MKISELDPVNKKKALEYQKLSERYDKKTDDLYYAFNWHNTVEGDEYWNKLHQAILIDNDNEKTPTYYDNSNGSLYQFAEQKQLNTYEFDIIKRVMRCRKKGQFIEDLQKTKNLIDLYIKEWESRN